MPFLSPGAAAHLEELFHHAPAPVLMLEGPDHVVRYAKPAYLRFVGSRELIGRPYREALSDIAAQGYLGLLDEVFRSGRPFNGQAMPTVIRRPAEPEETRYFDFVYQPILDHAGGVRGIFGQSNDVTDRVLAEAAVRDSQARLELATEAAGIGVWEWRLEDNSMIYSRRAKEICGFPPDGPVSHEMVVAVTHPDDYPLTSAQAQRAFDPTLRDVSPYEYRIVRPDGEVRWVVARGQVVFDEAPGSPRAVRYVGVLIDVTEQRLADERLKLLAREVDHRANNLLAVVQSLVSLSRAGSTTELKDVVIGRLHALANSHQLLSEARWQGADLRRLVEEELLGFTLGQTARVRVSGDPVRLNPAQAQGMAMALHELATNAAKYGALSTPEGHVEVEWRRTPPDGVVLRWTERGGPPVTSPQERGFGSILLGRALAGSLGGDAQMDWRPEGLVCTLRLPALQTPAELV